jgi:dihydrolipoamide dehydrogenase
MSKSFDVVVIGAGPGGYVAAIRASQLGLKTAIIEREHLGGVCLNWGCIPTKSLLRTAEIKHLIDTAESYGITVKGATIDLEKVVARSRAVSAQLATGVKGLLAKNKVTVIHGTATFNSAKTICVEADGKKEIVTANHIIIATGARARLMPNAPESNRIWTAKQAMTPEFLPKSLLIIGSGAIGIEFASFYKTLGSAVTVVEMQNRILPNEDEEISKLAEKTFSKQGMQFHLNACVKDLKAGKDTVTATLELHDKKTINLTVDAVIVAIGIVGNTEGLGLEKTKIRVEKNQIIVDEWCQTHEPGVYAVGDVAGAPWLAHKASHEAIICVEKIAKQKDVHPLNKANIPGCTYSLPQIASVGLTEAKAKEQGLDIKVGRFAFRANGKAQALGETEGLVKTIFHAKTGELLGAHMIGAEVTELVQGFVIAKTLETTETELMHTIFPHPTLSEMMHESVLDAYGRVIHS